MLTKRLYLYIKALHVMHVCCCLGLCMGLGICHAVESYPGKDLIPQVLSTGYVKADEAFL